MSGRRMTYDEWKAITAGLLVGAGIDPAMMVPPNLRGRERKPKEKCANDGCDNLRTGNKSYCSAECCKAHRQKEKQHETSKN